MITKIKKDDITLFEIQYQAVCLDGRYRGRKRDTMQKAREDARRHQQREPNHIVSVKIIQSSSIIFSEDLQFS